MEFNANTVLITGGGSGIGFALAERFIQAQNQPFGVQLVRDVEQHRVRVVSHLRLPVRRLRPPRI